MKTEKVWFITGASKGLGLALVKQLLSNGNKVCATSRNKKSLVNSIKNHIENFLPLEVDLTNEDEVKNAIDEAVKTFKRLDVIVNNAGYGLGGSLEEITDKEIREQFDVNVFAMLNVIRQSMPYLRIQRSGHLFNISSISGFCGDAGMGSYNASKFAVTGLTEALAAEVKPFNINVTLVAPGFFRTNFLNTGSIKFHENKIEDYKFIHDIMDYLKNVKNGNQEGDPKKAASAIIKAANSKQPPVYLFLGRDAYEKILSYFEEVKKDIIPWKDLSYSTDIDNF